MTRDEALVHLQNAAQKGTLMAPKHDPNNLATTYADFRSVLSFELANNLENFINSGEFKITEHQNTAYLASPIYLELEPSQHSTFSIPASGVPGNSPFATTALDRLVAVSGHNLGWHVFGESSAVVQQKIATGQLLNGT